ncbi:MAG: hypothetical protein NTX30_02325, partial [Deltaproteobacteria bacterium]|nr:hypothetical protein [Deltaproteobacteria bacterium]
FGHYDDLLSWLCCHMTNRVLAKLLSPVNVDDLVKSLLERHPGESRGPEHLEITGFRLSPE